MINFDDYVNKHKLSIIKIGRIFQIIHRVLIIGGSGSGKTNVLLNLIENQPDIDKIYLYAKDPYEAKYQQLINKREGVGINHFNDPKLLLNIQMICAMLTKILMNINLIKKTRY